MTGITVHFRVKNEEQFIRAAILAVLPLADRIMVCDTGSTDATLDEIARIKSSKIELVRGKSLTPLELTILRNEMIEQTTTEWYMVVDGDEIYPAHAVECIPGELERMPSTVHRVVMNRKHFVSSLNLISSLDGMGRIFRTRTTRWGVASSDDMERVGHETPYLKDAPLTPWPQISRRLPKDIFFYHCQFLTRSLKDDELGDRRRWRKPPFPVMPYLGPWPESLPLNGRISRWVTPDLLAKWVVLNGKHFWTSWFKSSPARRELWQLKTWPSKGLITLEEARRQVRRESQP